MNIRGLPGGINQSGVRNHNERVVLSLIRRHGGVASAEVARSTNLSAQTASVITRALEADGFLKRGAPKRGKVGKPLVPLLLNSDGVFSYGLRIGRRSADLVLVDFIGGIREQRKQTYPYPTPEGIMTFLETHLDEMSEKVPQAKHGRIAGIGIAAPFELWNWLDAVGAPTDDMMAWRGFQFDKALADLTPLEVFVGNDATLSCAAEHMFGGGMNMSDFAYFYIGSFVGGGIVLGNSVLAGRSGNAGAFGTIPVRDTRQKDHQLIHNASLFTLERQLQEKNLPTDALFSNDGDWHALGEDLNRWINEAARHLATASIAACSVLDFEAVVIDGGFPGWVRDVIVGAVDAQVDLIDTQGIARPKVVAGSLGRMSGAIGAAYQPIISRYLIGPTPTITHDEGRN